MITAENAREIANKVDKFGNREKIIRRIFNYIKDSAKKGKMSIMFTVHEGGGLTREEIRYIQSLGYKIGDLSTPGHPHPNDYYLTWE